MTSLLLLPLALLGCKSDREFSSVTYEDIFNPVGTDSADILFVVDDSVSMSQEQWLVASGFGSFIAAVGETSVDFQIGVITTDMDVGNWERGVLIGSPPILTPNDPYELLFMERVQVGTDGSDKERGLQAALHALTSESVADENAGFIRGEESVLALVFVTDENDCSDDNFLADDLDGNLCYGTERLVPVNEYVQGFKGVKGPEGRVVASGIVGPRKDGDAVCDTSYPGTRYMTVIEQLDGVVGNICDADYGQVMDDIGARISGPMRIYTLTKSPISDTIVVEVDGEEIPQGTQDGWTFDAEYNTVRFDGDYYPAFGTEVIISYSIAAAT